jgi:hypothetical protein
MKSMTANFLKMTPDDFDKLKDAASKRYEDLLSVTEN